VSPATSNGIVVPGLGVLEQSPIIIEKLVHLASTDQLRWKPAQDRWSISEILAHLVHVEGESFRDRIELMIKEKNPPIAEFDQNAAYAAGKYSGGAPLEHLKVFCHERDRTLSFLRYMSPNALSRTGVHAIHGTITVGQLMNEWAFHDLGHIRQIAELFRARAFFPVMGPLQTGYTIRP
jgi:DinB superfamily